MTTTELFQYDLYDGEHIIHMTICPAHVKQAQGATPCEADTDKFPWHDVLDYCEWCEMAAPDDD